MLVRLAQLAADDADGYGRKAATLGALIRAGFTVPEGYALPVSGLAAFLRDNGFTWRPAEYPGWSAEIRQALAGYLLSASCREELGACVEKLRRAYPDDCLIVRTSALCEDREVASLAGLFVSFGGLTDAAGVEQAVRGCYQSLFADAVLNHCAEGRLAPEQLQAGVIIQRCVAGAVSGVTFTVDPTTAAPDCLRITAVRGPCSGATDGSVPATTCIWDRQAGGPVRVTGEPLGLSPEWIHRLADSALAIEGVAGSCQDIEWTVCGDELYILQARPITALRRPGDSLPWPVANDPEGTRRWRLRRAGCLPPLVAELVSAATDAAGAGAYRHGMDWDSVATAVVNGYVYEARREIPDGKERLDAYLRTLNEQWDRGEGEFSEHVRPELEGWVASIERDYLGRDLTPAELLAYLGQAEAYLLRAAELHWRATTSEWFLGHFLAPRLEPFIGAVGRQDLVDLVHSKSMMMAERQVLYGLVAQVQASADLTDLFASHPYDSLLAARLARLEDPASRCLREGLTRYGQEYGWLCQGELDDGLLPRGGPVPLPECVGRLRRYLHVSLTDWRRNVAAIQENAKVLQERAEQGAGTPAERDRLACAIEAGRKAFLAGDDHAYFICAKKFVYVADALVRAGEELARTGCLAVPDDIRFLQLAEVRDSLQRPHRLQAMVAARRATYAACCGSVAPSFLGPVAETASAGAPADAPVTGGQGTMAVARGESGTRRDGRGRVHRGFPAGAGTGDMILVLEHGHEGDLSRVLRHVRGIVMKWGTPACHMGIIARELGLPAVYGVGESADHLRDGDEVEIHGLTGEVVVLSPAPR